MAKIHFALAQSVAIFAKPLPSAGVRIFQGAETVIAERGYRLLSVNRLAGAACRYSRNARKSISDVGMYRSIVQRALSAARQITAYYNLIEGNWRGADFLLIALTMSADGRSGDTLRV